MLRGHLHHFHVVLHRRNVGEGFVDALHELRWEARLHVLKLAMQLLQLVLALLGQHESFISASFLRFWLLFDFRQALPHLWQIGQEYVDVCSQQSCHFLQNLRLQGLRDVADALLKLLYLGTVGQGGS